jgi:hypothetical protein
MRKIVLQDRRWGNYEQFDDALVKLKTSKDANSFKLTTKKITTDQKAESQAIADLSTSLRSASPDVADKVSELQKLDG